MRTSKTFSPPAAQRIDALIAETAELFRALPRDGRAPAFRELLSYFNLPGGYARRGAIARPLVESLKGEIQC